MSRQASILVKPTYAAERLLAIQAKVKAEGNKIEVYEAEEVAMLAFLVAERYLALIQKLEALQEKLATADSDTKDKGART